MRNRLREIRLSLGMTQEQLAKISGISRVTISKIENETVPPDGETIVKLVKATNVSANEIFFDFNVV